MYDCGMKGTEGRKQNAKGLSFGNNYALSKNHSRSIQLDHFKRLNFNQKILVYKVSDRIRNRLSCTRLSLGCKMTSYLYYQQKVQLSQLETNLKI